MYPDSPFAHPVSSFQYPVPVPTVDPDDPDTLVQLCLSSQWVGYVAGCLKQLWLQSTWDTDDPTVLHLAQMRSNQLVAMLAEVADGCGLVVPDILCISGHFADDVYGYVSSVGGACVSPYVAGTGFVSCDDGSGNQILGISRLLSGVTDITSYSFDFSTGVFAGNISVTVVWKSGGSTVRTDTYTLLPTNRVALNTSPVTADEVVVSASFVQTIPPDQITLNNWSLCYVGLFPLAGLPVRFSHVFDFTVSDGGFTTQSHPTYPNTGTYVGGVGWESDTNIISGADAEVLQMHRTFFARTLDNFEIRWTAGAVATGGYRQVNFYRSGGLITSLVLNAGSGTYDEFINPAALIDEIQVVPTTNGPNPTEPHIVVFQIVVGGAGTDPF